MTTKSTDGKCRLIEKTTYTHKPCTGCFYDKPNAMLCQGSADDAAKCVSMDLKNAGTAIFVEIE